MIPSFFSYLSADQKGEMFANNAAARLRQQPMNPTQIATLQNNIAPSGAMLPPPGAPKAMLTDYYGEAEAIRSTTPGIVDPTLSDTDLLRKQMAGGASALFDTAQARIGPDGGMNYGSMKPIRGGHEELFANPKFAALLRSSPQKAAEAYQAITGRDMGDDFQQRQKLDLARRKEMADTIRGRTLRGEDRHNEETGFFERRVSIPDPNDPMKKVDAWETMDTPSQLAYSANWENAMGLKLGKANPIASLKKSPAVKAAVMNKYINLVKAGTHTPAQALEEAITTTPDDVQPNSPPTAAVATPQTQAANQPMSGPIPMGLLGTGNIAAPRQVWEGMRGQSPLAGPAGWAPPAGEQYDAWATEQAGQGLAKAHHAIGSGLATVTGGAMGAIDKAAWAANDWNRISSNIRGSIGNIPSHISAMFGGQPTWNRPESKEEMIMRITRERQEEEAARAATSGWQSRMWPSDD